MEVLLVGLLRAAHGEHRAVAVERRQRLAPPRIARLPGNPRVVHHLAEDTRNVDLRMLDDEDRPLPRHPYHSRSEASAAPSASVRSLA